MFTHIIFALLVNFSWVAPTTGGPVEGYRLYYAPTPGGYTSTGFTDVGDVTSKVIDVDLANQGYWVVRAYNSAGEGPSSIEVNVTLPLSLPGVPENFHYVVVE